MTSPRRVALFLHYFNPQGGADKMMLRLCEGLVKSGIEVDVVVGGVSQGIQLEDYFGASSPTTPTPRLFNFNAKQKGFLRVIELTLKLSSYLKNHTPQALLATKDVSNFIAPLARRHAKSSTHVVIRQARSLSEALSSTVRSSPLYILYRRLLTRLVYRQADKIVTVSQEMTRDLVTMTGLPVSSFETIYNPTITEEVILKAQEQIDHPWFREDVPVLLGAGRLTEQKDFPTLIRAFALIQAQRPVRLMILGEGQARASLEALIASLNLTHAVVLPGFTNNPYTYMARASVFVLSSKFEGLPNALIEALALGTPVVATNCPTGPNEILEGGTYGPLVPVGDEVALAKSILHVLDQPLPRSYLSARGRSFSLEVATQKYLEVMKVDNS
jgi:glycosyltransferase involved in cell wall biosynthesis